MSEFNNVRNILLSREDSAPEGRMPLVIEKIIEAELESFNNSPYAEEIFM
ncbi:hypothetical protein [Tumidithrix elongata]